jgi:hypothetical protein
MPMFTAIRLEVLFRLWCCATAGLQVVNGSFCVQ